MAATLQKGPPNPGSIRGLDVSVRRARLEMGVVLGAWVVFFLWVSITCAVLAEARNEDGTIPTLFGIPRWACLGVAFPWLAANLFICWFSFGFMQDTPLSALDDAEEADGTEARNSTN